jgi:hypothetical protein
LERFFHLIQAVEAQNAYGQRDAVSVELAWCDARTDQGIDRMKYRAILLVLRDLMGQGWQGEYAVPHFVQPAVEP